MAAKPPLGAILKSMVKDPLTWAGILLPIIVAYLIVGSMPRNYPSIGQVYLYCFILVMFSIYSRFDTNSTKLRVKIKIDEVDKMMRDLTNLIKKTKDPVKFKKEQEKGEFQ